MIFGAPLKPQTPANRHCPQCWVSWYAADNLSPCWSCGEPTERNGIDKAFVLANPAFAPDYSDLSDAAA